MRLEKICFSVCNTVKDALDRDSNELMSRESIAELVSVAENVADTETIAYRQSERLCGSVKCEKGCNFCCHMQVCVTAPEVLCVFARIAERCTPREISALKERLEKTYPQGRGLTDKSYGQLGISCPLLVSEECSIYSDRPIECRAYVSTELSACKAARDDYLHWNVPIDQAKYAIYKSAQAGILAAVTAKGYDPEILELNHAMLIALRHSDPVMSWLNKEPIFEPARISAGDPDYHAIQPWSPSFDDWIEPD